MMSTLKKKKILLLQQGEIDFYNGLKILFVQIEEEILDDPFKLNSGGLVTGKDMKGYKTKTDAYDVGTQFYKETHIRLFESC